MKRSVNFNSLRRARRIANSPEGIAAAIQYVAPNDPEKQKELARKIFEPVVSMRGKCTTCRKLFDITSEIEREARMIGVPFSPCCHAVSTIEQVIVKSRPTSNTGE